MTTCTCTESPNIASECICHAEADAVRHLAAVRRAFLSERNAHIWLHTFNRRLDGVPADLILAGAGVRVAEGSTEALRMIFGAPHTNSRSSWQNEQARQREALPGRYTPLVPRPEGGALMSILPSAPDTTQQARRVAA